MNVSVADLKKNYEKSECGVRPLEGRGGCAEPYIPDMVQRLKDEGYAHYDQGALVVDVQEEADTKEVPPCMILKSDGAALYDTTDLATHGGAMEALYQPDEINLCGGQASGTAFCPGIPLCKEDGNCAPEKTGNEIPGIWYDEWEGRQAV